MLLKTGFAALSLAVLCGAAPPAASDLTHQVNVFIGTGGHGHTYPGATVPFGAVQLSPDTYQPRVGLVLRIPHLGQLHHGLQPHAPERHRRRRHVRCAGDARHRDRRAPNLAPAKDPARATARASPTRRKPPNRATIPCLLKDYGIKAELTATERAGFHKYTFPKSDTSHFIVDLAHAYRREAGQAEQCSPPQI